jgi:hypothetical protein
MRICVLISTIEKYRVLAEFTERRIREYWAKVPEIRYCGLAEHPAGLELRDDPRSWMGVTRSACDDLMGEGFEAAYVILDDHPPMDWCQARNLNRTLPKMMEELGAVSVSLSGVGQGRTRFGTRVEVEGFGLDHCARDAEWKYTLHPTLWRLADLREILDRLIAILPPERQTPWAFERVGGAPDVDLPERLKMGCYRIEGRSMAAKPCQRKLLALRLMTDVYRCGVRRLMGENARAAVDGELMGVHHFYNGPYPLFWSGVLRKGRLNPDFMFYLKLTGRTYWLHDLEEFLGGI